MCTSNGRGAGRMVYVRAVNFSSTSSSLFFFFFFYVPPLIPAGRKKESRTKEKTKTKLNREETVCHTKKPTSCMLFCVVSFLLRLFPRRSLVKYRRSEHKRKENKKKQSLSRIDPLFLDYKFRRV